MAIIGIIPTSLTKKQNKDFLNIIEKSQHKIFHIYLEKHSSNNSLEKELTKEEKFKLIEQINICDGLIFVYNNEICEYESFIKKYAINNKFPTLTIDINFDFLLPCFAIENFFINCKKREKIKL